MLNELGKLAVASTAATLFIWVLSLLAPRCLPEHLGDLVRFAACWSPPIKDHHTDACLRADTQDRNAAGYEIAVIGARI
jgi:hypothetical protein